MHNYNIRDKTNKTLKRAEATLKFFQPSMTVCGLKFWDESVKFSLSTFLFSFMVFGTPCSIKPMNKGFFLSCQI